MSMLAGADITPLFIEQLRRCKVQPTENVIVIAEPGSRSEYVAAAFAAARALGANVSQLTAAAGSPVALPTVRTGTGYGLSSVQDNRQLIDFIKSADFVVDLTLEGFIHSPVMGEILGSGTRMLYIGEPLDVLERNVTSAEDKLTAQAASSRLGAASSLRVTSAAGTDLVADLNDSHPGFQCGFADDPGRWDHWPSLMVLCWPRAEGVHGTLVLDVNDVLFPFKSYVTERVHLTIESGMIVDVRGGRDADMLRSFLDEAGDPQARMTSHMGWGLQHTADWWSLGLYDRESVMGMEARAAAGNFLISTGPNHYEDRWTPYHLDLPMRGCTVTLDGVEVTRDGALVEELAGARP